MTTQEYLKMGETLFAQGSIAEAEENFLHVLEVEPENKEALNNLGVIAFARGNLDKAKAFLKQAIDCDPLYLDALINLCKVLQSTGSLAEALPFIERAIALKPEDGRLVGFLRDAGLEPSEKGNLLEKDQEDSIGNSHGDSGTCPRERPLRVIHLPVVIANNAISLSKYLNRLGVESKVISYFRTWLGYQGDINLDLDGLSIGDRNKKVALFIDDFLKNEAHKYDIFHFHFFDSLSTGTSFGGWKSHPDRDNYWDLEFLKNLGKKIVVSCWGSDIRNNSKIVYYQLKYEQIEDNIPIPPLNRKDQYYKIWKFAQYADTIVFGSGNGVVHAPYGTMIPIGIDLEPFDHLLCNKQTENRVVSIVHAPSNHFYKGSAYVEKILEKIRKAYGSKIEIRIIHGLPHDEAMKQYFGKGIAIDQIGSFAFGLFALEMLYLGRKVFTSLHKEELFCKCPKLTAPIIHVSDENDFYAKLIYCIEKGFDEDSNANINYVRDNFSSSVIANRYKKLYEKLMSNANIEQYVSQTWYREFNLLLANKKVDTRGYYPKVTDILLAKGDFERLLHETQNGFGLSDDIDLLVKYIFALNLANRKDEADAVRKANRNITYTKAFKYHYERACELHYYNNKLTESKPV